jgi:hypothetical protein
VSLRIGLVSKARLGRLSPAAKIPFPAAACPRLTEELIRAISAALLVGAIVFALLNVLWMR